MNVWTIHFLEVPRAACGERQARLRSKETWAVLASLILPALLRQEPAGPVARETLADRFWFGSETVDPRTHLRQCLSSLREAFGAECLIADRLDVRIAPCCFTTDIGEMLASYQRALKASASEERLHWLMEAEAQIRGQFFEGWTPDTPEAHLWLIQLRADVHSRIFPILLLLAETLEETGNLNGAFDITRRILQFQPGHVAARQKALRLAEAVGQHEVMQLLEQTGSFREATAKLSGGLNSVILEDRRRFERLFAEEITSLSSALRKALLRLSVLPAPFPAEIASAVCRTPLPILDALAKTTLLDKEQELFVLPKAVRDCAWIQLPGTSRRRLQERLRLFCMEALMAPPLPENTLPPPFRSVEDARPFLRLTLQWIEKQKPTVRYISFINLLRYYGIIDLAMEGMAYLQNAMTDPGMTPEGQVHTGVVIAYILMHAGSHAAAISPLEYVLPLATAMSDIPWLATLFATLMMIYTNLGEWTKAREHGVEALKHYRELNEPQGEAHCVRFLAEIELQSGDPEVALQRCNEALALCYANSSHLNGIADALYWKARILCGLQRWTEAESAIAEAFALWQDAGDTRAGLCLCVLGRIRAEQGRFPEARAHLEYAIYLHQRTPMERHRIVSVEALGDLFHTSRRYPEAQRLYRECLDYYRERSLPVGKDRLRAKIQSCFPPVQAN